MGRNVNFNSSDTFLNFCHLLVFISPLFFHPLNTQRSKIELDEIQNKRRKTTTPMTLNQNHNKSTIKLSKLAFRKILTRSLRTSLLSLGVIRKCSRTQQGATFIFVLCHCLIKISECYNISFIITAAINFSKKELLQAATSIRTLFPCFSERTYICYPLRIL